jgi:predicted RNA-binding Zn-ribbon protein involved in translation (DUF1610 family)
MGYDRPNMVLVQLLLRPGRRDDGPGGRAGAGGAPVSHNVDEIYDVYQVIVRRARTAHHCSACGLQIAPGERYAAVSIVFDGTAETIKRCGRCQKVHEHLQNKAGGETWPDERLACGQNYETEWGEEPPPEIQAALFMTSGEASSLLMPRGRYHMMNSPWSVTVKEPTS